MRVRNPVVFSYLDPQTSLQFHLQQQEARSAPRRSNENSVSVVLSNVSSHKKILSHMLKKHLSVLLVSPLNSLYFMQKLRPNSTLLLGGGILQALQGAISHTPRQQGILKFHKTTTYI